MKARIGFAGASLAGILLAWGCSGERVGPSAGGGGIETGDLTVLVARSGEPNLSDVRVWILADPGDSAQARALDSSWASSEGAVSFLSPSRDVGVEAWSGDTLAALERGRTRVSGDTVRLDLVRPVLLVLPCAPYAGMEIHQPGSIRKWVPPSPCIDSFEVPVVPPARLLRAVPSSPPRKPSILLLDSARFGKA